MRRQAPVPGGTRETDQHARVADAGVLTAEIVTRPSRGVVAANSASVDFEEAWMAARISGTASPAIHCSAFSAEARGALSAGRRSISLRRGDLSRAAVSPDSSSAQRNFRLSD